jgi:hypothetical protein
VGVKCETEIAACGHWAVQTATATLSPGRLSASAVANVPKRGGGGRLPTMRASTGQSVVQSRGGRLAGRAAAVARAFGIRDAFAADLLLRVVRRGVLLDPAALEDARACLSGERAIAASVRVLAVTTPTRWRRDWG